MADYVGAEDREFNMAVATLERMHECLLSCDKSRLVGMAPVYIRALGMLVKEVGAFLSIEEEEQAYLEYRTLNKQLKKQWDGAEYNFMDADIFELWLRRKMREKRLLMPIKDPDKYKDGKMSE